LKKKRKGNRKVGQSFPQPSLFSQSFLQPSFFSQSFPQPSFSLVARAHLAAPPFSPFLLLPCAGFLYSASATLPRCAVAPFRLQCARPRPTDQPCRRPHLLDAEPQSPGLRKSIARSAFTAESMARTPRAPPPPLNHQAASPVTSLNRNRSPSHAQLALAIEFLHDRHYR
jgi:hypothetical protein